MFASHFARLATLSIVAIAGLTAAVSAAEIAYTKSTANLREGPGTSYAVITSLPKNSEVTVEACTATWCAVTTEDNDEGFLAKSLLKANKSGADLPFSIQILVGPSGPFLNFGVNVPPVEPEPADEEVCFYQQANFKGANFCVESGDYDVDIPGSFDNNIESILVGDGMTVEVCSGNYLGGDCKFYTNSVKSLPSYLRNRITSYSVDDGYENSDDFEEPEILDPGITIELN